MQHQSEKSARSPVELLEARVLCSTYWVTNTNDSGSGSLRQAIIQADSARGNPAIDFAIGSGLKTIKPLSALPVIKTPMTIDATTQGGYAGKPLIQLNGSSAGNANGLQISSGGATIKGLIIDNFKGDGILATVYGNNTILGNYIGTDATGSTKQANTGNGILLGGGGNVVGGTTAAQRNVISGNGINGLEFAGPAAGKNLIEGNYIGVNAAGTAALGNTANGLDIKNEPSNTIGGTAAGAGNVISGNGQDGIILYGNGGYNTVQGNLIGLDATGRHGIGNAQNGIENQTSYNLIGGTTPSARNIVSGNAGSGLILWGYISKCTNNLIEGNYFGTDITGTIGIGNWGGITFSNSANNNTVGGTSAADRNLISGNTHIGVGFYEASDYNLIEGNYIGTDVTGHKSVSNRTGVGVYNNSTNNTIGGRAAGAGNTVSGNAIDGIDLFSNNTIVEDNILGLTGSSSITPKNGGTDLFLHGSSGDTILGNL